MAQPYDRLAEYLSPGDYFRFTGKYGKSLWMAVERDEPIGQIRILFDNLAVAIPPRPARAGPGSVVPPATFIDPDVIELDFLEPQREDRMYQIRPTVFAIDRATQMLVPQASIPPLVLLEYQYPMGHRMAGTDRPDNVTMNGCINQNVGGPDNGRIPVNQIYSKSDPNEIFDMFIFFRSYPGFRVLNATRGSVGGAGFTGLGFDWYLAFQGRKYVFRTASVDEQQKLDNHELPYRSISSPGGVPPTLLRRE